MDIRVGFIAVRFAGHGNIAADGQGADAVLRLALLALPQQRSHAERKLIAVHMKELGRDQMAPFMNDNDDGQQNQKIENRHLRCFSPSTNSVA